MVFEAKGKAAAKKKQRRMQVKEMKFRPGTDEGDYQVKLRNLTRFLSDGDKAKVTLRFRGREMATKSSVSNCLSASKPILRNWGPLNNFQRWKAVS